MAISEFQKQQILFLILYYSFNSESDFFKKKKKQLPNCVCCCIYFPFAQIRYSRENMKCPVSVIRPANFILKMSPIAYCWAAAI